jgi:EAL domain-containing protein (putative c-di-GMP-specific phosphodiesterase class I)
VKDPMRPDGIKPHLLVVDDEPDFAEFLAAVAGEVGYRCTTVSEVRGFEEAIRGQVDLIMLDLVMPGADGIELLRMLARRHHPAGVILMSGFDKRVLASAEMLGKELGLQVRGHLQKPIRADELEAFLAALLAAPAPSLPTRPATAPPVSPEELASAIRERQFELHYQPQIEVATGALVGVEALVRWRHPQRGLIYPDSFISLAEKTGQIDALSWIIYEGAAAEFRGLCETHRECKLSLNLSAYSLRDLATPEKLIEIAIKSGLQSSSLVLEITETGLMRELASALDILTRLRMKGMELSIDDFGTGYSMMDQLRRVPATELKIDRSFVGEAGNDESSLLMVEKTIEIGRRLKMRVVAEGVETEGQLALLRKLGCDVAQGYLFSRPVPMPALISWAMEQVPALGRKKARVPDDRHFDERLPATGRKPIEWRFRPRAIEVTDGGKGSREEIEAVYELELTGPAPKEANPEGASANVQALSMTIAPGDSESDYDVVLVLAVGTAQASGSTIARGSSPDQAMRRGLDKARELVKPAAALLDAAEDDFGNAERPPWRLYRCSAAGGVERFVVARTPRCARGFYIDREKVLPDTHVECRDVKELLPTAKRLIPAESAPGFLLGYASPEMLALCGMTRALKREVGT